MGDSADGFWLRIEIYTRRTDPQRWCFEQTRLWRRWWQWSILLCSWQYLFRPIQPGDQVRHQNWAGIVSTLSRCHRTNKKRHLEIVLRSRERLWTTERRLDHSQWNHLSRSYDFHSTQTKTHGDGQSSWESTRQKCNRNCSSNDGFVAGISHDVLRYVSKCKKCHENRPSLGKTVSTWPETEVSERLHMDWGYIKDQGNILVIVDAGWIEAFPVGNRTSETVRCTCVKSLQDLGYQEY